MKLKITKTSKIPWWWFIAFILAACTSSSIGIPEMQRTNQFRAAGIIEAINQYHKDHKQLPGTLTTLVPAYLSELPKTTTGDDFSYMSDATYVYTVCFYGRDGCCYQQAFHDWDCSGEAPES